MPIPQSILTQYPHFEAHANTWGELDVFSVRNNRHFVFFSKGGVILNSHDKISYPAVGTGQNIEEALESLWKQVNVSSNVLVFEDDNDKNSYVWDKTSQTFFHLESYTHHVLHFGKKILKTSRDSQLPDIDLDFEDSDNSRMMNFALKEFSRFSDETDFSANANIERPQQ